MSRQVGFTFQGDVFLGSSLAVSATGRLLKLFSDAGVDTYAVAAVLQLGKQLPISQHREMVVSTAMLKRGNSRAGFLAKALRIGWGCNDTAYELSRTREGSAALMLADAFAAGRTYYLAAQALQELLSVSGCDREYLPSVTALKGLVSHVAPIMEDSGFHAILEHIRVTTTIALRRLPPSSDVEHDLIGILNDDGLPRDWAGIVKQLMLVASREETAYLQTNTRGAWFAAFAVHILSMECALLHHSNVLWHAAGSQGAVTIQLAIDSAPPPRQRFWCSLVLEVNPHSDNLRSQKPQTLETFYILRDALQIELSAFPGMSVYFQNVIQSKIVRILVRLVQEVQIGKYWSPYQGSMINNEAFRHPSVVRSVLRDLGINLDISILGRPSDEDVNEGIVIPPALLEACPCKVHRGCGSGDKIKCFQIFFDRLVWGIAATAMALLICESNASRTPVSRLIFNGSMRTRWFWSLRGRMRGSPEPVTFDMLLGHLRRLVHGEATWKSELPSSCLGVSSGGTTIAFKALFDEEAFTEEEKVLAIYPGRVTAGGEFREYIKDGLPAHLRDHPLCQSWSLAEGTAFSPPSADGLVDIRCELEMEEHCFRISCVASETFTDTIFQSRGPPLAPRPISYCILQQSVAVLLHAPVGHHCGHSRDNPFVVPTSHQSHQIRAGHFCVKGMKSPSCILLGTQGNKLRQLFSIGGLTGTCLVFRQGASCLSCAFDQAQSLFHDFRGIMMWQDVAVLCE